MSELSDRLSALEKELDALRRIKTQEDFDEGARLHTEKNAPWVKGQYSDIKFPPYQYRPFPRMVYTDQYEAACQAYDQAALIPAHGTDDRARAQAMKAAERAKDTASRIVQSQAEWAALGPRWFESPTAAVADTKRRDEERAVAQAHREYEDRNLGEPAKREAQAFDDAAEDFTPEIPTTKGRLKPTAKTKTEPAAVGSGS